MGQIGGLKFPRSPHKSQHKTQSGQEEGSVEREKPESHEAPIERQMLLVSLNNFDFFFRLQPLWLMFLQHTGSGVPGSGSIRRWPSISHSKPSCQPHPSPFPFSSYSGFLGHCNLVLPSEHKSGGHSSGFFEKH